ncbi:MAG TPA: hypothetical protein VN802_14365 [Stellaceae bacterium]|nr:hypothetical protein [Stellaceae bacterium]
MWFAVAIIGIIAIATGVTLLPHGTPETPPASAAPASSSQAPPAQGGGGSGQR